MDKILVVGDPILDLYLVGHVCGVAQDSPVRVSGTQVQSLGGACNVAANVQALGGLAVFCTAGRRCHPFRALHELLTKDDGIPDDRVFFAAIEGDGPPPSVKTRIVAGTTTIARHDNDYGWPPGAAFPHLKDIFTVATNQHGEDIGLIVVSDYAKGLITDEAMAFIHEWADPRKVGVVLQPKPRYGALEALKGNWGVVLNQQEFAVLDGIIDHEDGEAEGDLPVLLERAARWLDCRNLVVTRGGAGAVWCGLRRGEWEIVQLGSPAQHVLADVTGAGDVFLAALCVALNEGTDWDSAVEMANVAAGLSCTRPGTVVLSRGSWYVAMGRHLDPDCKLMDALTASKAVDVARQNGMKIGVVNGCFDILHPGHLKLIRDCKSQCHLLVALVDDDASVRSRKGEGRPYQPLEWRMEALASLQDVSIVVPFANQGQLADALSLLAPDVMTKGEEYRGSVIPGAEEVEARGGEVRFVETKGYSTTGFVESLRLNQPGGDGARG